MKFTAAIILLFTCILLASSLSIPPPFDAGHSRRDGEVDRVSHPIERRFDSLVLIGGSELEKRRGGGGGAKGGGGGGGGGGAKAGGASSGAKSGGSSSSSGGSASSGAKGGSGSSSSNTGGSTASGSGAKSSYGGGRYYGGGASVPYAAGSRSPLGITPFILPIAALSIFSGLWLYSVYAYPFANPYTFINHTITNATFPNGIPTTLPALCLCEQFSECGCDQNNNSTYIDDIIGNGSYVAINKTLAQLSNVNGTVTLVLNGTLPNGTTAASGTSSSGSAATTAGSTISGAGVVEASGWWVVGAVVGWMVWMV